MTRNKLPQSTLEDPSWADMGPPALRRCQDMGIQISLYGTPAPTEIEGMVDDLHFYFRARGSRWRVNISDRPHQTLEKGLFYYEQPYGTEPFAASWMPLHEALGFLCDSIARFRAREPALLNRTRI